MRMVSHWNRLPRVAVDAPTLAVFRARLGEALSNLVQCQVSCPWQRGLGLIVKIHSHTLTFCHCTNMLRYVTQIKLTG